MSNDRPRIGHTVKQLAALASVSVRTLHHYDAIGLLKPGHVGGNGYRYYGRAELLRLQQIMLHRRLGMTLAEIARVIDAPDFDQRAALARQRARLSDERDRLATMIDTIDRTLTTLEGDTTMTDAELYTGFVPPEKQAGYEAWLIDRYGTRAEGWIDEAKARPAPTADEVAGSMDRLREAEQGLAAAMRDGIAPTSPALDPAIALHRDWVAAQWGRACPPAAYAGLAEVYDHPDFRARYEAIAPGFADWLPAAMKAWAARQG